MSDKIYFEVKKFNSLRRFNNSKIASKCKSKIDITTEKFTNAMYH